jgi:hypothetical protein
MPFYMRKIGRQAVGDCSAHAVSDTILTNVPIAKALGESVWHEKSLPY